MKGLGPKTARGLARCGFGDQLIAAYSEGEAHFRAFLPHWRTEVITELRTNARGLLPNTWPSATLNNWPDITILDSYVNPLCSATSGQGVAGLALRDRLDMSLPRLAKFCEDHFDEWGHRSRILERFYNFMWDGAVFHVLRRAALEADEKEKARRLREGRSIELREPLRPVPADEIGTPASLVQRCLDPPKKDLRMERLASAFVNRRSHVVPTSSASVPDTHPLVGSIVGSRQHLRTDKILEYRVVIRCKQLEDLANKGITGKHPEPLSSASSTPLNLPDDDGVYGTSNRARKTTKPTDRTLKRIWVAASLMRQVHPKLVERFETEGPPRVRRGRKDAVATDGEGDSDDYEDEDSELPPSQFTAAQEALFDRVLGITGGSRGKKKTTSGKRNNRVSASQPALTRHNSAHSSSAPQFASMEKDLVLGDTGPLAKGRGQRPAAAGPSRKRANAVPSLSTQSAHIPVNVHYQPSQFNASQEAMMDRALGIGGRPSTSNSNRNPGTSKKRGAPRSTSSSLSIADPLDDDPLPSQFTAAQEAMIDAALGLGGSATQKRPKTNLPRKRPVVQDLGVDRLEVQHTKRRRANPPVTSTGPSTTFVNPVSLARAVAPSAQPSSSKQRAPATLSRSQEPTYRALSSQPVDPRTPYTDDVIEISDDDEAGSYASSSKKAPMVPRTNAWDMMPSSSQESRLDDIQFNFDFS